MGLLRRQALGRAELARALGLSKTALGDLIGGLLDEGLLEERGERESPGERGRRPAPLHVQARRAAVIGVDLSATSFEFGSYDLLGEPLQLSRLPSERGRGQAAVYRQIVRGVRAALGQARALGLPVAAVGIAAPGPLDAASGTILAPPSFPDLHHLAVTARLEEELGLPVRLERNTTAAATAHLRRSDRDLRNFVYLLLMDQGIGAGLVIDRQVYRGTHGYAGEFGHVSLDVSGPPCPCGNHGCLERVADVDATEQAYARHGEALGHAAIVARAQAGEALAQEVLDTAGQALGRAAVSLVNLLDPQALILGGVGAQAAPFLLPALRRELGARAYPFLSWGEHLDLRVCDLPNPSGQGAAECVLNAIYRGDIGLPSARPELTPA
ncbi:ROK family protein [Deinococcus koreensis]|uniref:ROK family protein n=2 Tax=Deinococcus koreensis TaxID=2054903 RepID=A0A2K3UT70_9DEIO|nr:ROK family protein [Deinococcus koreensis]